MGMDVYGRRPRSAAGSYFRNSIPWFVPLWDYCTVVAPEITAKEDREGGLDARDSKRLANLLREEMQSGHTEAYAKRWQEMLAAGRCSYCRGTGCENDAVGKPLVNKAGQTERCSLCNGPGMQDNDGSH